MNNNKFSLSFLKKIVLATLFIFSSYLLSSFTSFVYASNTGNEYLTLNNFSGNPGSNIQLSGGNFAPLKKIDFYLGNNKVTSSITSNNGGFSSINVFIPVNAPQGNLIVKGVIENILSPQLNEQAVNGYYVTPFTPSMSVSYSTNTPGSIIIVSGSGFSPTEAVDITLGTSLITISTDASGSFMSAKLSVPNIPSNTYQIIATGKSSLAVTTSYFYVGGFYPSIYPSLYFLLPDQILSFGGSGYMPLEKIQVMNSSLMSSSILSSFNANSAGSFINQGSITIPFADANQTPKFKVYGVSSKVSSTLSVSVGNFYANVSPVKYSVMPNDIVNFNGTGFANNEFIDIYDSSSLTPLNTIMSDINGKFSDLGNIKIAYSDAGSTKMFKFVGKRSNAAATSSINIGRYYVNASASSYYILPGQNLSFSGSGYVPGEIVDITEGKNTEVLTHINVNSKGGFVNDGSIVIPFSYKSTNKTYHLIGNKSNSNVDISIGIGNLQPQISASNYYLIPGKPVTFSGSGFASNENISVIIGLNNTVATFKTDTKGNFTGLYVVPFKSTSNYHLLFLGLTSNASASLDLQIAAFTPSVSVDTYYAQVGSIIYASGNGFAANEKIDITIDSNNIGTVNADKNGIFLLKQIQIQSPKLNNKEIISFIGKFSGGQSSLSIGIKPFTPQVQPSTYYAKQGTPITFTGTGFPFNESISISLNGAPLGKISSDNLGNFTTLKYILPFSNNAHYVFKSDSSSISSSIDIGLEKYSPVVSLDNYYAKGGSPISINLSGFFPGESVNILFGNTDLGNHLTDLVGNLVFKTTVPFSTPGSKLVKVIGSITATTSQTTFTQAPIYVSVQLDKYSGKASSKISFIGSGYLPNETIVVTSNRAGFTNLFNFNSSTNGDFNSIQILPLGLSEGNITLSIKGNNSLSSQDIIFYVLPH